MTKLNFRKLILSINYKNKNEFNCSGATTEEEKKFIRRTFHYLVRSKNVPPNFDSILSWLKTNISDYGEYELESEDRMTSSQYKVISIILDIYHNCSQSIVMETE